MIEQPVRADDLDGLLAVSRATSLPVYADEGCVTARDVPRVADRCDGVVVKLQKCGGLLPALEHVQTARLRPEGDDGLHDRERARHRGGDPTGPALRLAGPRRQHLLARDPFDAVAARRGS